MIKSHHINESVITLSELQCKFINYLLCLYLVTINIIVIYAYMVCVFKYAPFMVLLFVPSNKLNVSNNQLYYSL